jgi:hypothetical protein
MVDLPSGTVTFLFTDVEGSTRLLKQLRACGRQRTQSHTCRSYEHPSQPFGAGGGRSTLRSSVRLVESAAFDPNGF